MGAEAKAREGFDSDCYKCAWDWFRVHADQRMDLFRFFVLFSAALATAYVTALQLNFYPLATVVGVAGVIVSLTFRSLDQRVSNLLKMGENALAFEQERLKDKSGNPHIELVRASNDKSSKPRTFRILFGRIFVITLIIFSIGTVFGVLNIARSYQLI